MHTFSPETLLSTSLYERVGSDRVLPTSDPITPYSTASRAPLTIGIKSDISHAVARPCDQGGRRFGPSARVGKFLLRQPRRSRRLSVVQRRPQGRASQPLPAGSLLAHSQSGSTWACATTTSISSTTQAQTSPRIGFAYHFNRTKSVLHAAYNRYFSPPPIEYSLLASFIGNNAVDPDQRVGNVRGYRQNYFEAGWSQELHPRVSLELNTYLHTGHD